MFPFNGDILGMVTVHGVAGGSSGLMPGRASDFGLAHFLLQTPLGPAHGQVIVSI